MRDRRTEHGHHRIADEFLNRVAVTLDLLPQPPVIGTDACSNILGIRAASEAAVNPTKSQNSTETTLRSSRRAAGAAVSGVPHSGQNLACPEISSAQEGHRIGSG